MDNAEVAVPTPRVGQTQATMGCPPVLAPVDAGGGGSTAALSRYEVVLTLNVEGTASSSVAAQEGQHRRSFPERQQHSMSAGIHLKLLLLASRLQAG